MNATPDSAQFFMFKDTLARRLLNQSDLVNAEVQDDSSTLDEFTSYLAAESWTTIPSLLKTATYENREQVPDADSIPLESTSIAFIDTLISYGLASDSDQALNFLRKALSEYVEQACASPPVWSSTRTTECEICDREVPLTYHHLIPRSTHAKVLKKGWHPEHMINSVAWLCRPCHTAVHHVESNEELARNFFTVDLILQREDIQKWQKYASKQRFGVRRG